MNLHTQHRLAPGAGFHFEEIRGMTVYRYYWLDSTDVDRYREAVLKAAHLRGQ